MNVGVIREIKDDEQRVALTPAGVRELRERGHTVWIEAGARPLPRKFVITYKDELSSPQYIAVLTDWNLHPRIADDHFVFHPPAGADEIDFIETDWEGDEDEESGS